MKCSLFLGSFHFFVAIENVILFLNCVYETKTFLISTLKNNFILLVLKSSYITYK